MSSTICVSAANVTSLDVKPGIFPSKYTCKITLQDGRELKIGCMAGSKVLTLIQNIAKEKITSKTWSSSEALMSHFSQYASEQFESVADIFSLYFAPEPTEGSGDK